MEKSHNLLGSIVMGAFATSFGAALGLALNSMASMTFTAITFWRLLGISKRASD